MIAWAPLFGLALVLQNDNVLTLEEALALGDKQAFSIMVAQSNADEAAALVKVARSPFLPSANVAGSTSYFKGDFAGGQNGGASSTENTNSSVTVSVQQIIDISGVNRSQLNAAKSNRDAALVGVEVAKNSLRGQIRQQYFTILQARELVTVQEQAVVAAKERLEKARIREAEGAIPRFDVLRLEVDLKRSEQAVTDAEGQLKLAKQGLNNLLGRAIDTQFSVEGSQAFNEADRSAEDYVRTALVMRPEIEQAVLAIESLFHLRRVEDKAALPKMNVSAQYQRNVDPGPFQTRQQTTAALTVTVPITTGGVVAANARAARERENRAKIQYEQLQLGVALEVQAALTTLVTAKEAYETAVKTEEFATEALRLAQLRYDENAGILLDVITAQSELTSASANVAAAAFRVRSAYGQLQTAVGKDDLSDLVEKQPKSDEMVDGDEEKIEQ